MNELAEYMNILAVRIYYKSRGRIFWRSIRAWNIIGHTYCTGRHKVWLNRRIGWIGLRTR